MDRVGLPTAVRLSARPRHRSVDGGAPHAVVKSLPQRNLDGYSAASSQARATCKKYRPLCRFSRPSPTETLSRISAFRCSRLAPGAFVEGNSCD